MSDNILIFIPVDSKYTPGASAADQAVELLKEHLPQAEVTFQIIEDVEFVATGGNLEKIVCPICHAEIDEDWWINAMDEAYEKTRFADLTVTLPCCGNISTLNDLLYEWPTGFARFQLRVLNPGKDVEEATIHDLERILGCSLRKIWAHF
jgi:hypothetical protein